MQLDQIIQIKNYLDKKKIEYSQNHYFKFSLRPYTFYLQKLNTCIDLQKDYLESKLFYCSDNIIDYIKIKPNDKINKILGSINTYRDKL